MKIAIRGGHTERCSGASGIINELTEDRKVKDEIIAILSSLGHNVLDCTPPVNYTDNQGVELAYGVDKANDFGAELFISIHFNNAYKSYKGAIGSEICVYSEFDVAKRIAGQLGNLGFINRGQKIMPNLYELKHTKMKAAIVEVCFVEATEDVELYKNLGVKKISEAIVSGIIGETVSSDISSTKNNTVNNWVYRLQGVIGAGQDNIAGPITLSKCPLVKMGSRGEIVKLLQEKLNALGFNCGQIDGMLGNKTYNAIILFQSSKGLVRDGEVGQKTWRKLLGL